MSVCEVRGWNEGRESDWEEEGEEGEMRGKVCKMKVGRREERENMLIVFLFFSFYSRSCYFFFV